MSIKSDGLHIQGFVLSSSAGAPAGLGGRGAGAYSLRRSLFAEAEPDEAQGWLPPALRSLPALLSPAHSFRPHQNTLFQEGLHLVLYLRLTPGFCSHCLSLYRVRTTNSEQARDVEGWGWVRGLILTALANSSTCLSHSCAQCWDWRQTVAHAALDLLREADVDRMNKMQLNFSQCPKRRRLGRQVLEYGRLPHPFVTILMRCRRNLSLVLSISL